MTGAGRHYCSVELLPHLRLWVAWCSICGQVGMGEEREADAWAVADRHMEIQGFERRPHEDPAIP